MRKNIRTISSTFLLSLALVVLSACWATNGPEPEPTPGPTPKPKGIVALVYSDLTTSINDNTAVKQKENIRELFQKLPVNTKFSLSSIDQGSNTFPIYEFAPEFPPGKLASDELDRKKRIEETERAKQSTELDRLTTSLNSYHSSIAKQKGLVSCISNKLNSLLDIVRNKKRSFKDYEIRVFFYSDMIEECGNSFDGQELKLKRLPTAREDEKNFQDIQTRIKQNFQQADPEQNLKSLGAKVYIVWTAQDDKQSINTLKTIWSAFFTKLGLESDDLVWANGNEPIFWRMDQ